MYWQIFKSLSVCLLGRQAGRQGETQADRLTDSCTERQKRDIETDRPADWLPTDRYISRQAGQQAGKQKDRQTERQTSKYFPVLYWSFLLYSKYSTYCMWY
jgi:hypothetical protein